MHAGYRRAGKIIDNDMLYTLSLFALEGMRWVRRYEWREASGLEWCALGVRWVCAGCVLEGDMEIEFECAGRGGRNGLEWHCALERWSVEYEKKHMESSSSNHKLAVATMQLLGDGLSKPVMGIANAVFGYLMDPQLRQVMRCAARLL